MRAPGRRQRRDTLSPACSLARPSSIRFLDRCTSARPLTRPAEELRRKYKYNHLLQSATSHPPPGDARDLNRLARTIARQKIFGPFSSPPSEANPRWFQA